MPSLYECVYNILQNFNKIKIRLKKDADTFFYTTAKYLNNPKILVETQIIKDYSSH